MLSPVPLCTLFPYPLLGISELPVVSGTLSSSEASPAHTFTGASMVLLLLTAALTRRLPGILMGSGATERLCSTTGFFLSPQFSQAKPPTCSIKG